MEQAHVTTSALEVGYRAVGPVVGPVVLLLHGFPDDASSWDAVAGRLAEQGRRVLAPHLRGVGPTSFRSAGIPRSGQLGALVTDAIEFLDALGVDRVVVAGQDWGARIAQGVAALQPQRVEHLVSLGSYGLTWDDGGFPPARVLHALWYQWVLLLELGPAMLRYDPTARNAFYSYLWDVWSPSWPQRQAAFDAVRDSLSNPDFTEVVLSAYRHGRADTVADPHYDTVDAALDAGPQVTVPTTILLGADDGVEQPTPDEQRDAAFFPQLRGRRLLPGVGHWPHQEAPDEVAAALLDFPAASAPAPAVGQGRR